MPRYLGLHLGAEYNAEHPAAGPPMNELVAKFWAGTIANERYFRCLVEQVACFGDPDGFYFDDVSRIRARGSHTDAVQYRRNVQASVGELVALIAQLEPRVIIVAGGRAHHEFVRQVLPHARTWHGHLVRARNPSNQGHWGSLSSWIESYKRCRPTILEDPIPDRVLRWHLKSPSPGIPFQLLAE